MALAAGSNVMLQSWRCPLRGFRRLVAACASVVAAGGGFAGNLTPTDGLLMQSGTADDENVGFSVSIVGDVDGDGRDDVVVGSPGLLDGGVAKGGFSVYKLNTSNGLMEQIGPSVIGTRVDVVGGGQTSSRLGIAVSAIGSSLYSGDVNGDGRDDILVGASPNQNADADGRAYIYSYYYDSSTSQNVWWKVFEFVGEQGESDGLDSDQFGYYMAGPSDINDDGRSDVAITAFRWWNSAAASGQKANWGRSYVFFLPAAPSYPNTTVINASSADIILEGTAKDDEHGRWISGMGDLDADGFAEFVVGEPGYDNGGTTDAGRVRVYRWDDVAGEEELLWSITGAAAGGKFGYGFAGGARFDDQISGASHYGRYNDLIVTAPSETVGANANRGRAYFFNLDIDDFSGSPISLTTSNAFLYLDGEGGGDQFGRFVIWAGDIDGDGYHDCAITSPTFDDGSLTQAGRVYAIYSADYRASNIASGDDGDEAAAVMFTGDQEAMELARVFYGDGDIDGGGYSDLAIGAFKWEPPPCDPNEPGPCDEGVDWGRAYVFLSECGADWGFACSSPNEPQGDLDGNGVIDDADLAAWIDHSIGHTLRGPADVNHDGSIDVLDLKSLLEAISTRRE